MKLVVSPTARQQLLELSAWWNAQRPRARVRVEEAVQESFEALCAHPSLGRPYARAPGYRCWRLQGTPYLLFYRVDQAQETLFVVAAWSALRGHGPALPAPRGA